MQIFIHSVFSAFSFIIGLLIFWKQKGNVSHKILGWIFWSSMMISTLSSFFIYKGSWSAIHILSIFVAFWLIKAIYVSRFKPMNWMYIHASCMGAVILQPFSRHSREKFFLPHKIYFQTVQVIHNPG